MRFLVCKDKDDDQEQKDVNVWEDNWDDDALEDDFSVQLRYIRFKNLMPRESENRNFVGSVTNISVLYFKSFMYFNQQLILKDVGRYLGLSIDN